jgi:hypothetical protein
MVRDARHAALLTMRGEPFTLILKEPPSGVSKNEAAVPDDLPSRLPKSE